MSEFKNEMKREAKVRIDQYEREKAQLAKAPERIAELNVLIAEAQNLIATLDVIPSFIPAGE